MLKTFKCPHKDCMSYEKSGCKAIKKLYEDLEKCKFYKSKSDNAKQNADIKYRMRREMLYGTKTN